MVVFVPGITLGRSCGTFSAPPKITEEETGIAPDAHLF